jgi:hypothetical protein
VTKRLLKIALALSLAKSKMEEDERIHVCQYFGYMNGTMKK